MALAPETAWPLTVFGSSGSGSLHGPDRHGVEWHVPPTSTSRFTALARPFGAAGQASRGTR